MKKNKNPLYQDTLQLLKKYRDVVWSLELSSRRLHLQAKEGTDPPGQSRHILQSRRMLKALDSSVGLLRVKHKNGETYYWLLYYSFLSPQKLLNTEEVIEKLQSHIRDISRRTYYRKRREAVDALGAILWGYVGEDNADLLAHFLPGSTAQDLYWRSHCI